MKKRISLLTGILALGVLSALAIGTAPKAVKKVDAGAQKQNVVTDGFNDAAYKGSYNPDKWISTGNNKINQTLTSDSYLHNDGRPAGNGETSMFAIKDRVTNLKSLQFDIRFSSQNQWISVKFNKTSTVTPNGTNCYEIPMMIYDHAFTSHDKSSLSGTANFTETTGGSAYNRWITVKLEPQSSTILKAYAAPQGGDFYPGAAMYTLNAAGENEFDFLNCQIGIQSANGCIFDIDNIIVQSDNVNFTESFTDINQDEDETYYQILGNITGYNIAGDSYLIVENGAVAGDRLLAAKKVKEDTSVANSVTVIDAQFVVKFPLAATSEEKIAFVFGLPSTDAQLNQAAGMLLVGKTKATLKVFANGEQISDDVENTCTYSTLATDNGSTFNLLVNKNGRIELTINGDKAKNAGQVVEFTNCVAYAGYIGFDAYMNISHDLTIDNVVVVNTTYYVPVTKSVTHNFSNDFFGNEGYEDFYLPYSHSGSVTVKDGRLNYEACADDVFFGSAHQYDAFILDYKLCSVYVGNDSMEDNQRTARRRWIGLDLSRKYKEQTTYGNYMMLFFEVNPEEGQEEKYLNMYTNDESPIERDKTKVIQHKMIPTSLIKPVQYDGVTKNVNDIKEEDFLCVRWISDGTSISLYLKKGGDAEFTKYATVKDIELNGYFALANTGYTYLQYDDFSMANTSSIYVCADNEAPETITVTETEVIYDPGNVDVNLDEELRINGAAAGCGGSIIATSAILTTLAIAGVTVLLAKKSKKEDK